MRKFYDKKINIEPLTHDIYLRTLDHFEEFWGEASERVKPRHHPIFATVLSRFSRAILIDNKPVAYIIAFVSNIGPSWGYIHFVAVHKDYRRQGMARKLYELIFLEFKEVGVRRIDAVSHPSNHESLAFHTTLGFKVINGKGRDYRFHGDNLLYLRKEL